MNTSDKPIEPQSWGEMADQMFRKTNPLYALIGTFLYGFGTGAAISADAYIITSAGDLWQYDRVGLVLLCVLGTGFTAFSIVGVFTCVLYWVGAYRNRKR